MGRVTVGTENGIPIIEGGPHGINATHPTEFNAALLGFLAG